ncbi:MAG: outer membrane protein assembly factor BamA [Paracoccaceae bacterium]
MQIILGAKAVTAALKHGTLQAIRQATLALIVCCATLCTLALAPTAANAQSYSFSAVKVEGNQRVDVATILSYAAIVKGGAMSAAALNDSYQRIVASGLFEKVELDPQGGTLVIKVTENPTVDVVDFQGNKRLKDEDLTKVIKSKSRLVYSPAQAEADAAVLTELYRTKGRMAATITPRIIRRADNRVDLVFEITEGAVAEIQRLNFVGNHAFSDYRLRQVLSTKQAGILHQLIQRDTFVSGRLDLDKQLLSDFYLSRGFLDFQILDASATYSRERDATFVTFTIREGQSFKIGKVNTISEVEGVDAAEFDKVRRLRTGVTYSPNVIDNNVAAMESLALKKGMNFIRVDPRVTRNDRDGTLDITFAITRGEKLFVERIDIEGNTTTLDSVVRRQFHTVEGDPFNPREIRQAAERLRALGYFSDVQVNSSPGTGADQVVVKVDVTEQPTGSLSFGASYGLNAGFGLSIGFAETNFLGRGQSLSVNIQNTTDSVDSSIQFSEPAFLGRDLKFGFGAAFTKTTHDNAFYDTTNLSISPSISFPVSDFGRLGLNYKIGKNSISNVDAGSSAILLAEEGSVVKSSIGYDYSYDTRTSGLNPKGGILLRFGQDFAGIGGDAKYVSTNALALAETKVFHDDVTLRAIFEGGLISSFGGYDSRVTDRFFGSGKIRGFAVNGLGPRDLGATNKDALGGNIYAVAHLETDFPLGLPEEYGVTGGAFLDVGSVWGLDNIAGTGGPVDDSFHLRSVIGFTVFWKTPLGPLRLDFTHALKKETYDKEQTFDLTIATKF